MIITEESVVLAKHIPTKLLYRHIEPDSESVYAVHAKSGETLRRFERGKDYTMDYQDGSIARTEHSGIGDYSLNPCYGIKGFNHGEFKNFGNYDYMVFVDYQFDETKNILLESLIATHTKKTGVKSISEYFVGGNNPLKYMVYGDSISAGGEATKGKAYFQRLTDFLNERGIVADIVNNSLPGYPSSTGAEKIEGFLTDYTPDVASIAFGMNDQNIFNGKPHIGLDLYRDNLLYIIDTLQKLDTKVFLLSACKPNKLWRHTSDTMEKYTEVVMSICEERELPFIDVTYAWNQVLKVKDDGSLLLNNVNHPTNFGHDIYFKCLKANFMEKSFG